MTLEIVQDLIHRENIEPFRKKLEDLPLILQITVIQVALRTELLIQEMEEILRSFNLDQTDIDE